MARKKLAEKPSWWNWNIAIIVIPAIILVLALVVKPWARIPYFMPQFEIPAADVPLDEVPSNYYYLPDPVKPGEEKSRLHYIPEPKKAVPAKPTVKEGPLPKRGTIKNQKPLPVPSDDYLDEEEMGGYWSPKESKKKTQPGWYPGTYDGDQSTEAFRKNSGGF